MLALWRQPADASLSTARAQCRRARAGSNWHPAAFSQIDTVLTTLCPSLRCSDGVGMMREPINLKGT
ncbi:MAG: hypothetical protein H6R04_238 [Burkholderiaceae bacterium]|nr:hypothetical protein [Burkholderiaceae bacterium]